MSGKGVLIQSLIRNPELYHDEKGDPVWDSIYYFTGSAKLDVNLEGFKKWTEDVLHQDEKNPAIRDGFNPEEVREVIENNARLYGKQGKKASEYHRYFSSLMT